MDLADACLVHLAGELGTGAILTLDSDFQVYRWNRTRPFHLLVDLSSLKPGCPPSVHCSADGLRQFDAKAGACDGVGGEAHAAT